MKTTENQRVKILRETLGLTQIEFSTIIDLSMSLVSKIESGKDISHKTIRKLSDKFNVSEVWLESGKGEMFKTGTINENIEFAKSLLNNPIASTTSNPWADALVSQLKEENVGLRDQVKMLMQTIVNLTSSAGAKQPNFLKALENACGINLFKVNKFATVSGAKGV